MGIFYVWMQSYVFPFVLQALTAVKTCRPNCFFAHFLPKCVAHIRRKCVIYSNLCNFFAQVGYNLQNYFLILRESLRKGCVKP